MANNTSANLSNGMLDLPGLVNGSTTTFISPFPRELTTRNTDFLMTNIHDGIPEAVWTAFKVVHIALTVFALFSNCVSLAMIYGVVPRLTPPLQLLTSLAFTEMLAPWAVMTMYFPPSSCQDEIHSALLLTAHNASAVTLIGLAMSLNIATFRPLHYDNIATQKRIWIFINFSWIVGILTAHVHFLATLTHLHERGPYCLQVQENLSLALTLAVSLCGGALLITGIVYGRIMLHLRPIQGLSSGDTVQPRKSTRAVVTGILLVVTYAIGWVPYLINKFEHAEKYHKTPEGILVGLDVCQTLILLVCVAHPVICGVRMPCIQEAYNRVYLRAKRMTRTAWGRIRKGIAEGDELPSTPLNPIESIC